MTNVYVEPKAPGQVPPPAGKELMYVDFSLSNTGTETLEDHAAAVRVDRLLRSRRQDVRQAAGLQRLDDEPAGARYGTSTAFIYAVDPGSTGYTLTFSPEVDGQPAPLSWTVR